MRSTESRAAARQVAELEHENTRLRRELAAAKRVRARHELTLDGLTRALHDLRKGALALRAENAELRAALQGIPIGARRLRSAEARRA